MKGLLMSELDQAEAALIAVRRELRALEQKPSQWRSEGEKQAIRECKSYMKKLKAEIKSFQLPLF